MSPALSRRPTGQQILSRDCVQDVTKYCAPGTDTRPQRRRAVLRSGKATTYRISPTARRRAPALHNQGLTYDGFQHLAELGHAIRFRKIAAESSFQEATRDFVVIVA